MIYFITNVGRAGLNNLEILVHYESKCILKVIYFEQITFNSNDSPVKDTDLYLMYGLIYW